MAASTISAARHGLEIDRDAGVARLDGEQLLLRPRELAVLACLAAADGRVCTKRELERVVLGCIGDVRSRAIDQHVANLRSKLRDPSLVRTVRGVGYALAA